MAGPPIDRWLPTRERARAEGVTLRARIWYRPGSGVDLLEMAPAEQTRLAAVTLDARVLSRTTWEKDVEMSEALLADFPTVIPQRPSEATAGSYRALVRSLDAGPGRCSMCTVQRGANLCAGCGGTGTIIVQTGNQQRAITCPRCGGTSYTVCATCDGTGTTRRARVRYVDDHEGSLRYTYVPTMTTALEMALDEILGPAEGLPACLRFEPHAREVGGPYRSSTVEPSFHGYRFGDALARAVTAAAGIAGQEQVLHEEVRAWARPILWLRYRVAGARREAALTARADGTLVGVVAP